MTDKERMDKIYHVCKDSQLALDKAKSKLENATLEYLYAIKRHHEIVNEYLKEIQKLLDAENGK